MLLGENIWKGRGRFKFYQSVCGNIFENLF